MNEVECRTKKTADAIRARLKAGQLRQISQARIDAGHATGRNVFDLATADRLDREASDALTLPMGIERGAGGELIPPIAIGIDRGIVAEVLKQRPDAINLYAGMERVDLASKCGVLDMALDAAQDAKAVTAQEKMLAHQMAALHRAAMEMLAKSSEQEDTVEQSRLANTAARLLSVYQDGMLTFQRVRSGGRQTVTVQHVQVSQGGQAVIAGAVRTGGHTRGSKSKK